MGMLHHTLDCHDLFPSSSWNNNTNSWHVAPKNAFIRDPALSSIGRGGGEVLLSSALSLMLELPGIECTTCLALPLVLKKMRTSFVVVFVMDDRDDNEARRESWPPPGRNGKGGAAIMCVGRRFVGKFTAPLLTIVLSLRFGNCCDDGDGGRLVLLGAEYGCCNDPSIFRWWPECGVLW